MFNRTVHRARKLVTYSLLPVTCEFLMSMSVIDGNSCCVCNGMGISICLLGELHVYSRQNDALSEVGKCTST